MDLTARDNVIINAIMLGLSRRQARARFDEVIAFAELEEFIDLKLKNYSSGMLVRLAFATSIEVDAEILLIDEVLAVGDAAFQQKCFEQFYRLKREGPHDRVRLPRHVLGRALLQPRDADGAGHDGADRRTARDRARLPQAQLRPAPPRGARRGPLQPAAPRSPTPGSRAPAASAVTSASQEDTLNMCFEVRFGEDLDDPVFAATLRTELGHTIVVARSDQHGGNSGSFQAGDTAIARFSLPSWLTPSRYTLTPSLAREGTGADALALVEDMTSVVVHGTTSGGILELPIEARIERA